MVFAQLIRPVSLAQHAIRQAHQLGIVPVSPAAPSQVVTSRGHDGAY